MEYRDGKRVFVCAVDRLADDVGRLVAVERGAEHLDLEIDLAPGHAVEVAADCVVDVADIPFKIGKGQVPVEIADDFVNRAAQAVFLGVIAAVGLRLVALDVFGRDTWPDENEIVVEVVAVQDQKGQATHTSVSNSWPIGPRVTWRVLAPSSSWCTATWSTART